MEDNPYSAPKSDIIADKQQDNSEIVLASRSTRLVAVFLDTFILLLILIPVVLLTGLLDLETLHTELSAGLTMAVMSLVLYLLINSKLLVSKGQTVGKKIMNIKVIDAKTRAVPSAKNIIAKRYLAFFILGQIPLANIISFVDSLMIFRKSRKCLHDDFAGTIVVKV